MMLLSLARRAGRFLKSDNPGFSKGGKTAADLVHALCILIILFTSFLTFESVLSSLMRPEHTNLYRYVAVIFTVFIGWLSLVIILTGLIKITKAVAGYKY